jgi:hypothetical protein
MSHENAATVALLTCVTSADSQWEMDKWQMFVTYTRCGNVAMFTIYQHTKFQMTGSCSCLVIIINPMSTADLMQPVFRCFTFKKTAAHFQMIC